jgi:hypothetical protein
LTSRRRQVVARLPWCHAIVGEAKNKAVRVMTSEGQAMNRASNVPGKGLVLGIDRDAASVESDVTAKEKEGVRGGQAELQDVEHDLRWDRHASGA